MKFSEHEVFEMMQRMSKLYLESYPDDRESVERFLRWVYSQWGYRYTP